MTPAIMHLPHGGGRQVPRMIIIHAMAEYITADKATAAKFKIKRGNYHAYRWLDIAGLSAHCLITPTGAIIRPRRDNETAWHARHFNTDSLGIEFLIPGAHDYASFLEAMKTDYLTPAAFDAGIDQVRDWLTRYTIDDIKTHSQVDPARKKDPGPGFPVSRFNEALKRWTSQPIEAA